MLNSKPLVLFTKKITSLLFVAAILNGCSPNFFTSTDKQFGHELEFNSNSLWKTIIMRGEEEKFSGILAIQQSSNFISLALLDPTGITLLRGNVGHSGDIKLISSIEKLNESKIKSYLGKAIFRIFYLSPSEETCQKWLNRLCWTQTNSSFFIEKKSNIGPFLFWSASYINDGGLNEKVSKIEFYNPWNKTKLFLELIN
jgi:hypothetical protein